MNYKGIKKFSWKKLQSRIKTIYPEFAAIIDEISPADDYGLYVASYPYGTLILDNGVFQVPNAQNQIVPLTHSSIPSAIQEDLNYNGTMPVGLVSKNSIESFIVARNRIIPATLFTPGKMVALWRMLDEGISYQEGSYWNVTSGARTICMLPKITDKNGYRSLKSKYNLRLAIPQHLRDHWIIFSHLANHHHFSQPWSSEIIFFSKKWFSHKNDRSWCTFYHFLLNLLWQNSAFTRNHLIFNFAFSVAQENKNLKPSPYLADTVKHLIAIATGSMPGFATAIDDCAAPISGFQKVFLEDYGLKKYAPIIMHASHFSLEKKQPIYYSFQMPTTMVFSPKANRASSTMTELKELKYLMEVLLSQILKGHLGVEKTPFFTLANNVRYDFFHTEKDTAKEIELANQLGKSNSAFTETIINPKKYSFPEFAPLLRGCVSISSKK